MLLEAFAEVLKTRPEARLTLIGDGPERTRIQAAARDAGIAGSVTFAGYRSQTEVAGALAQTDIFVLPPFAEGVPVVLMEAMASEVPVVTTRIAGIPELVEDGVSGRVVAPGDAGVLASAIAGLLADPAGRRQMGATGRARVAAEFDVTGAAADLARLFGEHA